MSLESGINDEATTEDLVKNVFSLYHRYGQIQYEGEAVNQIEHALQSAQQAENENAHISIVLGALLHDVGHLVGQQTKTEEKASLTNHGETGKLFLARHGFPSEVTDLVEGHVKAKRYLVFKHPSYFEQLSLSSRYTLKLQGGPMTVDEAKHFEQNPSFSDIIKVRKWDEKAKLENMATNTLEYYQKLCVEYLKALN